MRHGRGVVRGRRRVTSSDWVYNLPVLLGRRVGQSGKGGMCKSAHGRENGKRNKKVHKNGTMTQLGYLLISAESTAGRFQYNSESS